MRPRCATPTPCWPACATCCATATPTCWTDLLAAGATEMRFTDDLPEEITDREPRPGDDDLVALACRRTTFEWVLRRTVLASDRVTLRHGVVVDGLGGGAAQRRRRTARAAGSPGSGCDRPTAPATAITRCWTPLWWWPRWAGARPCPDGSPSSASTSPSTRRTPGRLPVALLPAPRRRRSARPPTDPIGGDLGYLKYAVFQGDNRTFSVTFALGHRRRRAARRGWLDPDAFDRAAAALAATRAVGRPGR